MATAAKVTDKLTNTGFPTRNMLINLLEDTDTDPNGSSIVATLTFDSALVTGQALYTFSFNVPYALVSGKNYFVAVLGNGSGTTFHKVRTVGVEAGWYTTNTGATWGSLGTGRLGAALLDSSDSVILAMGDLVSSGSSTSVNGARGAATPYYTFIGAAPPEKAINPFYLDEENSVAAGIALNDPLSWEDGTGGEPATSYDVWFGTDFGFPGTATKVAEGITDLFWVIPEDISVILGKISQHWLNAAQGYTWRIDSINDGGTTTGDEWTFTTSLKIGMGGAHSPTPITTTTGVAQTTTALKWKGCEGSTKIIMYLGTATGELTKYKESSSTLTADIGPAHLGYNTLYYWRVDTLGLKVGPSDFFTITGNEWTFTTAAFAGDVPTYGVGAKPTIRIVTAVANNVFWYEDLI